MTTCTVTRGFFVLRHCGVLAVTGCTTCGRPLCAAHVADAGMCPECAVAAGYGTHPSRTPITTAAHRRRAFYSGSSHHYQDTTWYSSFDDYDREAFRPDSAADPDYGVDEDSGLVDS
ncbi:MAG: hypothetical protein GXX79_19840 [Actinomycetales bacterium]|nr:hypothetical protein [Actinomycetales bacterium]